MVPSLIKLISRSFGPSKHVCKTVGKPFERTRHHVATKNGISKQSFAYTKEKPIFESCQGATKSVVNWVLTSSILQQIHQESVQWAIFESKDSTVKATQSTVGFLDDNNKRPITQLIQVKCAKIGKAFVCIGWNSQTEQMFYLHDSMGTGRRRKTYN